MPHSPCQTGCDSVPRSTRRRQSLDQNWVFSGTLLQTLFQDSESVVPSGQSTTGCRVNRTPPASDLISAGRRGRPGHPPGGGGLLPELIEPPAPDMDRIKPIPFARLLDDRRRPAHRSRAAAAEASASVSRRLCAESQAQARRHFARDRERQQAARGRDRRARGRRSCHGRLLRSTSQAPLAARPPPGANSCRPITTATSFSGSRFSRGGRETRDRAGSRCPARHGAVWGRGRQGCTGSSDAPRARPASP
jgi:hypothetical protein